MSDTTLKYLWKKNYDFAMDRKRAACRANDFDTAISWQEIAMAIATGFFNRFNQDFGEFLAGVL